MRKIFTFILAAVIIASIAGSSMAYQLTLYSMPSPREINWKSPRTLAISAATNRLTFKHLKTKHAIGHVFIELSSEELDEQILTGSVPGPNNTSNNDVLKEGLGLGVLFEDIDGRLEDTEDLLEEIGPRFESGRICFIKFKLSRDNYLRLRKYLDEYRERGYGKIYNGLNLPRQGLGAGCSAFGLSFVEVAGLMRDDWEEKWAVNVRVPLALIGGHLTGNKVPLTKVAFSKGWAKENEPHRKLMLFEPYYIYKWLKAEWKSEKENPTGKVKLLKRAKAYGLEYDMTDVPAPKEPIFQGAAYDPDNE